jgi:SAM-dependent methyltransferase
MQQQGRSDSGMRQAWDRFSRRDPMFHIQCERGDWDHESFFRSGDEDVAEMMSWVGGAVGRGRMLELGCGIGRMTLAFGREFESVDAVDISEGMIEGARAANPPANVRFAAIAGDGLGRFEDGAFDFVASRAVFQHIPDESAIAVYLAEITRVLRPGGAALLQFNTAPAGRLRSLAYRLPDRLLPRTSRRYMRCYRRDPDWVRELAQIAGLAIEWERAPATTFHFLFLRAPSPAAAA